MIWCASPNSPCLPHASPHKVGEYKDVPVPPETPDGDTPIPEPATIVLFGMAATAAALTKKRRNQK